MEDHRGKSPSLITFSGVQRTNSRGLADNNPGASSYRPVPHYTQPQPPLIVPAALDDSLRRDSRLGHLTMPRHPIDMARSDSHQEYRGKRARDQEKYDGSENMEDRPNKKPFAGEYAGEMSTKIAYVPFSEYPQTDGGCLAPVIQNGESAAPIEKSTPSKVRHEELLVGDISSPAWKSASYAEGEDMTQVSTLAESAETRDYIVESAPLDKTTTSDEMEATPKNSRIALITPPLPKGQQIQTLQGISTPKKSPGDAQNLTPPMSRGGSGNNNSPAEGTARASPTDLAPLQYSPKRAAPVAEHQVLVAPAIEYKYPYYDQEMYEAAVILCEFSRLAWKEEEERARKQVAQFAPSASGYGDSQLGRSLNHAGQFQTSQPGNRYTGLSDEQWDHVFDQVSDDGTEIDPHWSEISQADEHSQ